MQFTHSKKQVVAVAAGLAIAGSVAASAASLGGLTSVALGADSTDVGSCDTDGIDVEYTHSFDAASGEYVVDSVELSDIAIDCFLQPYEFSMFQNGGGTRQVDGGPSLVFSSFDNRGTVLEPDWVGARTFTVDFPAADLDGVAMYIRGNLLTP